MPQISIDNREATRRGAEYLRDLGHTDVALVTLPFDAARTRGPADARARSPRAPPTPRASGSLGARDVFPDATGRATAASSIEEGLEAGRALLADPAHRPTAIIAQSDLLAAGVIKAAEELGIAVPAELSVIGFDGIRVDGLQHDLTTLVQPSVVEGPGGRRGRRAAARRASRARVGLLHEHAARRRHDGAPPRRLERAPSRADAGALRPARPSPSTPSRAPAATA